LVRTKGKTRDARAVKNTRWHSVPHWQVIASFLAILMVYVSLRLPGISIPLDRDEGAFGYMGQLINSGKLPYLDGLDHKPPVAFYLNAIALHIVPPTERGIHTALLIYNLLTLICVFFIGKIYFKSLSAGLWGAFSFAVLSSSPAIQGFTASTEMWMLLPISLSLLFAVMAERRDSSILLFVSGIAGAVACWTKQSAFTSVLFIFLFSGFGIFLHGNDTRVIRWTVAARRLVLWLAGAVLLSSVPVLYFASRGAFHEFFYWSFIHNLSYSARQTVAEPGNSVVSRLTEIFLSDFLLLSTALIAAFSRSVRKRPDGYFMLGFLVFSLLGTIPGFAYSHYFAQLAPASAIAGGYGLSALIERYRTMHGRVAASIAAGLLVLAVPLSVDRFYYFNRDPNEVCRSIFGGNPFPESKSLAAFIAAHTTPADKVFVVGSEPQILFYARRQSPSSFLMLYPLTSTYPRYHEFQETVLSQIQRDPPQYILSLVNIPWSYLWDGMADMDFLVRMQKWMQQEYTVDRAMTVTGLHGDWILDGDSRLQQGTPCVFILKKRE
jgi:MFS family permease